jgi:hypothetical protein
MQTGQRERRSLISVLPDELKMKRSDGWNVNDYESYHRVFSKYLKKGCENPLSEEHRVLIHS